MAAAPHRAAAPGGGLRGALRVWRARARERTRRRSLARAEAIRAAEIASVAPWLPAGTRVLEIGGGPGYQASILASWGCQVRSIDVAPWPGPERYFPVDLYDGRHIPFPDAAFDVVYSSNALEHIPAVEEFLTEARRVLAPEGRAVHLLPTPAWRFWTSAAHYVDAVVSLPELAAGALLGGGRRTPARRGLLRRLLSPPPHGEYPSALSELRYFSRRRWTRVFGATGFTVEEIRPGGLFYFSGCDFMPSLPVAARRVLSRVLGSACHVFVLRRAR